MAQTRASKDGSAAEPKENSYDNSGALLALEITPDELKDCGGHCAVFIHFLSVQSGAGSCKEAFRHENMALENPSQSCSSVARELTESGKMIRTVRYPRLARCRC